MATDYNVLMQQYNGTDYDKIYPKTKWGNIVDQPNILTPTQASNTYATKAELQSLHNAKEVNIPVTAWSNNAVTIQVAGVTANNIVIVAAGVSTREIYSKAQVYCSAQGNGTLTFNCKNVPVDNIIVNVLIVG